MSSGELPITTTVARPVDGGAVTQMAVP